MAKNKTDYLAIRANAEGIDPKALRAAIIEVEQKVKDRALEEADKPWEGFEPVTIDHMVDELTSARYRGGYMYPGTTVTPGQFQAIAWSRPGESVDANPVGARQWLEAAPVGAEVKVISNFGNGVREEIYQKTQDGWGLIKSHDEGYVKDLERQCFLFSNESLVAEAMGVGLSPTFRTLYQEATDRLYRGL